ncbi:MAG: hypothetical protein V3V08_16310 [Nannocystaceae bacterium]
MTRQLATSTLFALMLLAADTGCLSARQFVAADGSHRMVARDDASRLTVVLTTQAWQEATSLSNEMTIVHVLVSNRGASAVRLAPGDFELRNAGGFTYPLLDPGSTFTAQQGTDPGGSKSYDRGGDGHVRSIRGMHTDFARSALPWGKLEPGTEMRGFVYFERASSTSNAAVLSWTPSSAAHPAVAHFAFALHVAAM